MPGEIHDVLVAIRGPSPMDAPYGLPYPKWLFNGTVSASNRVPICDTHFGLQQRHNPNISILSWRLICRKGFLLGPVVGEDQK